MHGFPAALTSFVGRAAVVDEVAGRLGEYRLVTVTGPGGSGKTRLAGEVARRVAGEFADGVWLAELGAVRDPAQVPAVVAAALGVRDLPAVAAADALARALARRQLLLVLDNCEHVIGAAAELCGRLLLGADDVRVLATSREPLRIAGEVRYRLGPLTLPAPGDLPGAPPCEAVTLFADRARRADPGFTLNNKSGATVAQLVARLDGMPLAIELAAARVDALGVTQLLDRIGDRFGLLADGDRLAQDRHRSLAGAVHWSYQLLDEDERRVFRAVSVFPGPFTLDAAQAVAGPSAGQAVPRLVDCSLILPPHTGPDDRSRYAMLETLRAYGAGLLAQAGEEDQASAARAEDATFRHALAWAFEHDPDTAVRLALALATWWGIRGRLVSQAPLLTAVAELADVGSDEWCAAHLFLAQVAGLSEDPPAALDHFTTARDALQDTSHPDDAAGPWLLSICLSGRTTALIRVDRVAEALEEGRRALDLARQIGIGGLEAMALASLSLAVWYDGDRDGALRLARQALAISEEFAGSLQRGLSQIVTGILTEADDLAAAEQACAAALTSCRDVGDLANLCGALWHRTILDLRTGRIDDAPAHLRELFQIATQTGLRSLLPAGLDCCGHLCAATGRPAEAITVWAAMSALASPWPMHGGLNPERREELRRQARELIGPARARAAEERGTVMSLTTATEYAVLLASEPVRPSGDGASLLGDGGSRSGPTADGAEVARLSPRERELVTLVARGHTDAQIAGQLYITVRTVSSHLDRIRDKTGCRRRAELTRLALSAGLV